MSFEAAYIVAVTYSFHNQSFTTPLVPIHVRQIDVCVP